METIQKIGFDLGQIAEAFNIVRDNSCIHLNDWLNASYTLREEENHIIDRVYDQIADSGDYWNEEELKIKAQAVLAVKDEYIFDFLELGEQPSSTSQPLQN